MKWTQSFIPTLKEDPADAEIISHKLMIRAGLIKPLMAGVYTYLPLAWKSFLKIENIIREEMDRISAQEILMPGLNPIEIWEETGRNEDMGNEMYRLKDRRDRTLCLAPTHEEIITDLARGEIRSYKELPQIWYQIQTKFRDEPRPRSGLLRVKEFAMKDSYTLAATFEQLDESYDLHARAYKRIFTRCGLEYLLVGAASGLMGGSASQEFMVLSPAGEDSVIVCEKCGYADNMEIATSKAVSYESRELESKLVHTPNQRTIEEVSAFLDIPKWQLVKSLLYVIEETGQPVMALVRGDHKLNEAKLNGIIGSVLRQAEPEEAKGFVGADIGFIGPHDVESMRIIADTAIDPEMTFATGANQNDYHITGLKLSQLRSVEYADIRMADEGDICSQCGGTLSMKNSVELGHIFKLGTKYSKAMGATFLDEEGSAHPIIMGSYGIGLGRIMAAAIELYHDDDGIIWPITIAPYDVLVTIINVTDEKLNSTGHQIYQELKSKSIDVLLDDRDDRPGVKFKDADLLGFPIRVTIGPRAMKEDCLEIYRRDTKENIKVKLEDAVEKILEIRESLFRSINEKTAKITEQPKI
ncbi:MAG: proline--tRNA ligase [Acidobacteria bacterium]|nr:proline--tRNA ligase [Acidobacteriota bacterium]